MLIAKKGIPRESLIGGFLLWGATINTLGSDAGKSLKGTEHPVNQTVLASEAPLIPGLLISIYGVPHWAALGPRKEENRPTHQTHGTERGDSHILKQRPGTNASAPASKAAGWPRGSGVHDA